MSTTDHSRVTAAFLPSLTFCKTTAKEHAALILFVGAELVQREGRHIYAPVIWMALRGVLKHT